MGSLLGPEPLKKVASSPQLPKVPQTRAGVHEPLSHPSGDLLVLSRVKTEWGFTLVILALGGRSKRIVNLRLV